MMIKFSFFSLLAHLYLILASSVSQYVEFEPKQLENPGLMSQYGEIGEKQYNDYGLVSAYRRYLSNPTPETFSNFESYVRRYYKQSPIDYLKLSGRYQDWIFRAILWHAFEGLGPSDPSKFNSGYYPFVLKWISYEIRVIFLNCRWSDESKFTTELEKISLLIRLAERTAFELKTMGIKDELMGFDNLAAIWKYLIRNISFDFENKTIVYHSLFRTIYEICLIIKTDSSLICPSLCLSKRYALLWFYLRYIYVNNCAVIFETHHHYKTLIYYFIMKFQLYIYDFEEFYPSQLGILFEKLYENEPQQLDHIWKLLRVRSPWHDSNLLRITGKISHFIDLARFITESSEKYCSNTVWRIRAFAELEAYLIQHGRKVDYSTK